MWSKYSGSWAEGLACVVTIYKENRSMWPEKEGLLSGGIVLGQLCQATVKPKGREESQSERKVVMEAQN
jgi:hypothetical protein